MHQRRILAGVALFSAAALACAQTYPNKPIRIVVPYPAGGPIDMTTRPLAQKLNWARHRWWSISPVSTTCLPGVSGL